MQISLRNFRCPQDSLSGRLLGQETLGLLGFPGQLAPSTSRQPKGFSTIGKKWVLWPRSTNRPWKSMLLGACLDQNPSCALTLHARRVPMKQFRFDKFCVNIFYFAEKMYNMLYSESWMCLLCNTILGSGIQCCIMPLLANLIFAVGVKYSGLASRVAYGLYSLGWHCISVRKPIDLASNCVECLCC